MDALRADRPAEAWEREFERRPELSPEGGWFLVRKWVEEEIESQPEEGNWAGLGGKRGVGW